MDRITSQMLLANVSHRRVTRHQTRTIKRTFPFLDLPAELRNNVYEYCWVDNINLKPFFDKYYEALTKDKKNSAKLPKPVLKTHNNILLINKQIYAEASYRYRLCGEQSIVLNHGLLKIKNVEFVVSANILRNLTSLVINDEGHPIIKSNCLAESWHGYMRLIEQLSEILSKGHRLKVLTIDFTDKRMEEHMTTCWKATYECGFRDQLKTKTDALRAVRGVPCVTIKGINDDLAKDLKKRMESVPVVFTSLPREIRDMIYEEAIDWNDVNTAITKSAKFLNFKKHRTSGELFNPRAITFPLQTPGLLLVNKKISSEAIKVLHKKPLDLNFPGDHIYTHPKDMPIFINKLIGAATLQNVKVLTINLQDWQWVWPCLTKEFVKALAQSNNLEKLTVEFHDSTKGEVLVGAGTTYPDNVLHKRLMPLTMIRGVPSVVFKGDLPDCYTQVFKRVMESVPVWGEEAPRYFVEYGDGTVVDIEDAA